MEYAKYPFKYMRITQNISDGNHLPHWKGSLNHSDKPWDEAGKDGGQDSLIPLNDYKIVQILGLGANSDVTNTVIIKSVNKLKLPYGTIDYLYLTLTHVNETDLRTFKVGQILKAGETVLRLREGVDGNASGNHLHITANIGKYYGLKKNSNGKWCYTYDKALKPEEAFYVDYTYTKILDAKGSVFQEVPKEQNSFFDSKGYFGLGDTHANIGKIASFMYKTFPAYTKSAALGNYYGPNLQSSIKTFQSRTHLETDGNVGPKTLAKLKEYGFIE